MKTLRKKSSFTLALLLIVLLLSFQSNVVKGEPGDSSANAIPIGFGDTDGYYLPGPATDDSIWFVITLTSSGDYQFSLTGPGGTDFDLDLYDSSLTYIEGAYHDEYPDKFFVLDLGVGDYYINVYASSGIGAFTLNIATYTRVNGDFYDNPITIDLGDTTDTMPGPGVSGEIYYAIRLSAGDYQFSLTDSTETNFDLYLFDNNGNNLGVADDNIYPDILTITGLGLGNYLIAIFPITGAGEFTLNIATYIPPTGDFPANAIPIAALSQTVGEMPGPGTSGEIWYIITPIAGGRRFSLSGPSGTDFNLDLYNSNLELIDSADDNIYPDTLMILDLEAADYFIAIRPITGIGVFTLAINEYIPGKSSDSAIVIGLGETNGSLPGPAPDGPIWYVIPLDAGDYQFSLTGPGGTNFDLDVLDSTFYWIGGTFGEDYPERLIVSDLEAGDYYVAVLTSYGTGNFTLTIAIYAPTLDEPPANAIIIELGATTGSLPGPAPDGSILYNITLLAGDYQCSLTGPEGTNFNLELYDSTLAFVAGTYAISYPDILTVQGLEAGIYFINVYNVSIDIGTGAFTLTVSEYIPTTTTLTTTPTTKLNTTPNTTTSTAPIWIITTLFALILGAIIVIRRRR